MPNITTPDPQLADNLQHESIHTHLFNIVQALELLQSSATMNINEPSQPTSMPGRCQWPDSDVQLMMDYLYAHHTDVSDGNFKKSVFIAVTAHINNNFNTPGRQQKFRQVSTISF